MKQNRWLIILVSLLLIFNLTIYVLLRFGKMDEYILNKLQSAIHKAMNAEFSIGHFSVNDKQIFANNITLRDNDGMFHINVEKINIDYSLFYALQYKRQSINTVKSVRIYNPTIDLHIKETSDSKPKKPKKIKQPTEEDIVEMILRYLKTDTYMFIKHFSLQNGKVNLIVNLDNIKYQTQINNININLLNEHHTTKANISIADEQSLMLDLSISKPVNSYPQVEFNTFLPINNLQLSDVGAVNAQFEMNVDTRNNINYYVALRNNEFEMTAPEFGGFAAYMDSLVIVGNEDKLYIETSPINTRNGAVFFAQDATASLTGSVSAPFDMAKSTFILNLIVNDIPIPTEFINPQNKVVANILAHGTYEEIALDAKVSADLIQFTMPYDSLRTIKEDLKGFELSLSSKNALSSEFDLKIAVNEMLGSSLRVNGQTSPLLPDFLPFKANLSLYATDMQFQMLERRPQVAEVRPQVAEVRPQTTGRRQTAVSDTASTELDAPRPRRERERDAQTLETYIPSENYANLSFVTKLDFTMIDNVRSSIVADILLSAFDIGFEGFYIFGDTISVKADAQAQNFARFTGDVQLSLSLFNNRLTGKGNIDLTNLSASELPDATLQLATNRLFLNQIKPTLPVMQVTSNVQLANNLKEIDAKIRVNAGDDFVRDNFYKADIDLSYDKLIDSLDCQINIYDTRINYTPFFTQIHAIGDKSSLQSNIFNINDMMAGEFLVTYNIFEKTSDGRPQTPDIRYRANITADSLAIDELCLYFMNPNEAAAMSGILSLNIEYDNTVPRLPAPPPPLPILPQRHPLNLSLHVSDFYMPPVKPANLIITGDGDLDDIRIKQIYVFIDSLRIFNARAFITDMGKEVSLKGQLATSVQNILEMDDLSGFVTASVDFGINNGNTLANVKLNTENIFFNKTPVAKIDIDITQTNEKLQINTAEIAAGNDIKVSVSGALDYNMLSSTAFPITDSLYVSISGNPVRFARNFTDFVIAGTSDFFADSYLYINEDGLQFPKGRIDLNNTWLNVQTQSDPIENVILNATIADNALFLHNFRARLGSGSIFIRNEITNSSQDIELANLNLGKFFIRTAEEGFKIHVPGFMTPGTATNVIMRGLDSREATITGPIDDMNIRAEVEVANLSAIFPPNATNLMGMVNFVRSEIRAPETPSAPPPELPINLDLNVLIGRNNRYVTSPMNLVVAQGSFARLRYNGKDFVLAEAEILSEEGSIDLFGTFLTLETAEVRMSLMEDIPNMYILFTKKVADGTTISLTIYTDRSAGETLMDRLQIQLTSDNSDDTSVVQILTKLRYGKTPDQLSESQNNSLLQDEAIQIVGVTVGESLLDPFIAPIENRFRRLLKLDNIAINPGFVQNMISNKVWAGVDGSNDYMQNFGSSILLNNLTVNLGRYVHKNVFLEYELQFQEGTDMADNTDIFLHQIYGVRYDLPWKFKVRYAFELNPSAQKNAHEVFLMRSFRF